MYLKNHESTWTTFEYEENFDIGIKELESLAKVFFDGNGFPLSRNPNDLVFFAKYLLFCKELIKDSQKYVPEFLQDIIDKNLNCINFIKTPNDCLPLFNGATSNKLFQIKKYLENIKSESKNNNLGGLFKIKHKKFPIIVNILLISKNSLYIKKTGLGLVQS